MNLGLKVKFPAIRRSKRKRLFRDYVVSFPSGLTSVYYVM